MTNDAVKQRTRSYVDVYVEEIVSVPIKEIMESISDDQLIEEVAIRELSGKVKHVESLQSLALEALTYLQRGDAPEATLILERALYPKFASVADCLSAIKRPGAA